MLLIGFLRQTVNYNVVLCIVLPIGFIFPTLSSANGGSPTLNAVPSADSRLLKGKLIGLSHMRRGKLQLHQIYTEFGGFVDKHWF